MNIAILSRKRSLYSTRRLVEAAEARGHTVRVLDHLHCFMDIASNKPSLHYKTEEFHRDDFDAVIPRIGCRCVRRRSASFGALSWTFERLRWLGYCPTGATLCFARRTTRSTGSNCWAGYWA